MEEQRSSVANYVYFSGILSIHSHPLGAELSLKVTSCYVTISLQTTHPMKNANLKPCTVTGWGSATASGPIQAVLSDEKRGNWEKDSHISDLYVLSTSCTPRGFKAVKVVHASRDVNTSRQELDCALEFDENLNLTRWRHDALSFRQQRHWRRGFQSSVIEAARRPRKSGSERPKRLSSRSFSPTRAPRRGSSIRRSTVRRFSALPDASHFQLKPPFATASIEFAAWKAC